MSSPITPQPIVQIKLSREHNNNTSNKYSERQQARTFMSWYKHMIDHERDNLALYLSDDALLEWFGKTIKTRKKVSSFLKYDMQCSRHDFTTVDSIEKVVTRQERVTRKEDTGIASPHKSPDLSNNRERSGKKRTLRSNCSSPEWVDGLRPQDELKGPERKKFKSTHNDHTGDKELLCTELKQGLEKSLEINNKGDGARRLRRKLIPVTPPNPEVGQGDCLPSTSGAESNKSHDALNAQLPKLAVECNGYIEFTRCRNSRSIDSVKWERKCKVQISYSEDPLNIGEYILWSLHYIDESKCRRNLLAAFEESAKKEETVNV